MQFFANGFQLLVDFDGLLGHLFVGCLAASQEGEVWTGRDTLVAVGVQSNTEQERHGFILLGNVRHEPRLPSKTEISRSNARFVRRRAHLPPPSAGGPRPQHVARSRWSGEFQSLYTG